MEKISYSLVAARGVEITQGEISVNKTFGSFDVQLTLPEDINLGSTNVEFTVKLNNVDHQHTHTFDVQEVIGIF